MSRAEKRLRLIMDLGGVIVDHDNAKSYDRLIDLLEERPSRAGLAAFIAGTGLGKGHVSPEGLFEALRQQCGSSASQADFLAAWTCHFSLNREVFSFLESMRRTRPIVICSNTDAAHWEFLTHQYGVDKLAAKAVLSYECGFEKPSPELYLMAAAAHESEPQACLFVDDLLVNVEAAKSLGFRSHQFTGFDEFRRIVEEH
jgi:HAD superfamily hydrolase (TIGR01509 family)